MKEDQGAFHPDRRAGREQASTARKTLTENGEISNVYGMNVEFAPDLQAQLSRIATERGSDENSLVQEAVERFVNDNTQAYSFEKAQAAAASIRELRKGVTLGGLKLKDLIAEGRA